MGDGANATDIAKRQFVQRSLRVATDGAGAGGFDPLDPASISAQQRAARSMREGLNSAFGTSTRGTDSVKGSGLQGPPDPIIAGPTVTTQPGTNAVDDAAAAAERRQREQDARDAAGPRQTPGQPRTYRF